PWRIMIWLPRTRYPGTHHRIGPPGATQQPARSRGCADQRLDRDAEAAAEKLLGQRRTVPASSSVWTRPSGGVRQKEIPRSRRSQPRGFEVAGTGFEVPPENTGSLRSLLESGAESGAFGAQTAALAGSDDGLPDRALARLVEAWPTLA